MWSNPLVAVPKGLNKIRVCLDARRLNTITVKDKYPMPNVNRVFARMKKLKYFGTFDLNDAFMQTLLEDDAKEKTSFIVPDEAEIAWHFTDNSSKFLIFTQANPGLYSFFILCLRISIFSSSLGAQ